MNIHPIVVHFPIALLTVYSVLELLRNVTKAPHWKAVRKVLLLTGTIGTFFALNTGEIAEHAYTNASMRQVLELHSLIAGATTWFYAILAGSYVILWARAKEWYASLPLQWLTSVAIFIVETSVAYLLAAAGFIALGLTGALGGILVYGPDADVVTSMVYKLFF